MKQRNRHRREGRFLTPNGILRATDGVLYIYLFTYLSSANSKNCKLMCLNNPDPQYGAGKCQLENKCKQKKLLICQMCENSVSYSYLVYM